MHTHSMHAHRHFCYSDNSSTQLYLVAELSSHDTQAIVTFVFSVSHATRTYAHTGTQARTHARTRLVIVFLLLQAIGGSNM